MAAEVLKVGLNRIWIDPGKTEDVESAITREEIRKFIREKTIKKLPEKGISRARARIRHEKKKAGRRRGLGGHAGPQSSRTPRKETWMNKIRAQRNELFKLRSKHAVTPEDYRSLYRMAKSGSFISVADMKRYMDAHNLRRKR